MRKIEISSKVPLRDLDGGGTWLAPPVVNHILGVRGSFAVSMMHGLDTLQKKVGTGDSSLNRFLSKIDRILTNRFQDAAAPYNKTYRKAFEWCSGPGFIGFALLEKGICEQLCLADINPVAIESARATVAENGLEDRVTCYVSDNLESIPAEEKFDLVVSNPPNYFNINPEHPLYAKFKDDLRPNDREWRIHWEFYRSIKKHLNPGAVMLISEVEPFNKEVLIPKSQPIPYDVRENLPLDDFKEMIATGGLTYVGVEKFFDGKGAEFWMVISRNDTP